MTKIKTSFSIKIWRSFLNYQVFDKEDFMPRVSISDTNQTLEVTSGETVYQSLQECGVELPHGCLSGSCGACRIEILSGKEHLHEAGLIEKNTIQSLKEEFSARREEDFSQKEIRLACRAKISGDISIKLIK
jgi:ferredoxin